MPSLSDPAPLLKWFARHGIEPDPNKGSEDAMQLQLLALKDAERLAYRGESHLIRGEHHQALDDCDKALAADPECAVAYGVRALVHSAGQRSTECEADCNAAVRLGLKHPEVYFAAPWPGTPRGTWRRPRPTATPRSPWRPGIPGSTTAAA